MTETKLRFGSHRVRTARNVRVPIKSSVGAESLTQGKIGNVCRPVWRQSWKPGMSMGCGLCPDEIAPA